MILQEPEENYKTGWIRVYRSIKNSWLWPKNKPLTNLEAWLLIILEVNHKHEKVLIGYDIFNCDRGEKLYSLDSWAKLFNWNKSKVRRFFDLLQKDSMIVLKSNQKTTHIKVLNYDTYQSDRNASETQVKRKRNASETHPTPIKEVKNDKNGKNDKKEAIFNFRKSLLELGVSEKVTSTWLEVRKKKGAVNSDIAFNSIRNQILKSNMSPDECIEIAVSNSWSGFNSAWIKPEHKKDAPKPYDKCDPNQMHY